MIVGVPPSWITYSEQYVSSISLAKSIRIQLMIGIRQFPLKHENSFLNPFTSFNGLALVYAYVSVISVVVFISISTFNILSGHILGGEKR
jgi:hypothetical protein